MSSCFCPAPWCISLILKDDAWEDACLGLWELWHLLWLTVFKAMGHLQLGDVNKLELWIWTNCMGGSLPRRGFKYEDKSVWHIQDSCRGTSCGFGVFHFVGSWPRLSLQPCGASFTLDTKWSLTCNVTFVLFFSGKFGWARNSFSDCIASLNAYQVGVFPTEMH